MTTKKCICVWLDETTDSDEPKWIVSRDEINGGETEDTNTVSVHDTEEEATAKAKQLGRTRNLPVYLHEGAGDGYGRGNRHTLIQAALEAE